MQNLLARSFLVFLRLLQHLPLAVQAAIGVGLGKLLWLLAAPRRRVALRNLALCLPELPAAQRVAIAKKNFEWIARSFLERGLLWFASPERLRSLIHVEGDVGFAQSHPERAVMWLAPHFVALDVAGSTTQLFQS